MDEIDDIKLKDEIERIMTNVDNILLNIQNVTPLGNPEKPKLVEE